MSRTARALLRVGTTPPVMGALLLFVLAAWAGRRAAGDDAGLGDLRRADALETYVAHRFGSEVLRMELAIGAAAIALGLCVGLLAEVLIRLRHRAPPRGTVKGALETLAVCFAIESALVLWSMADSPQLYAARWYARGGASRLVQVFATDVLHPGGVVVLSFALALLYVRPWRAMRRARAVVAVPGLALLVTLPSGSGGGSGGGGGSGSGSGSEGGHPRRPNVLILAADSLRDDRVNAALTPNLAAIAARGTRFEHAYVSVPRTFPSWVTILTGRHAHHHGVRSMFPTWDERAREFDALPRRFARAGYATGVVSDYAGDIFSRIDLGFSLVDTPTFDFRQLIRQRSLERETPLLPVLHSQLGRRMFPVMRELNDAADPRLLADDVSTALHAMREHPFFLTVFFSAAHFPYAAPAPYYAKYTDPSYRGRFKYHKPATLGDDAPPDAADIRQINALHDGAVSAIDEAVARVLATLAREGLADDTIVVVTSDHGESLFEHGRGQGHGDHLFGDEGTHVPLIVYDPRVTKRDPGAAGRHEARIVRDVDLAPTLYDLADVPRPSDLDGESLAPAVRGDASGSNARQLAFAESELWFTEDVAGVPAELRMPYPGIMGLTEIDAKHGAEIVLKHEASAVTLMARHRMVRDERWKLVYVPTRKGAKYMLFDTVADPAEIVDVAPQHPAEVARLGAELWSWMLRDAQMEKRDGFLVPRASGSGGPAP